MATVSSILQNPFCNLPPKMKVQIVLGGRPRPPLKQLLMGMDQEGRRTTVVNIFDASAFDEVEWLTACEERNTLFCWPCLLFASDPNPWNTHGFCQEVYLQHIKAHERSFHHIQAMLNWQLFIKQYEKRTTVLDVMEQNELIKRNREIIRRIIDVVCLVVTEQKPPRIGTKISNDKNQLTMKECIERMTLLYDYDVLHTSIIDDAIAVLKISPSIINDVVDAISSIVKSVIQKETQLSSYVSVILTEHAHEITKSQISIVLRYLKQGKVCERFVGFLNSEGVNTTASSVFQCVINVVNEFQIPARLLSIALDGGVIRPQISTAWGDFKQIFSSVYPFSFLAPCYFHKLDVVLEQCLSTIQDCNLFFRNLKGIRSYFKKDSKMRMEFDSFLTDKTGKKFDLRIFDCVKYPDLFWCMKAWRRNFAAFLNFIIQNCEKWKAGDIMKAYSFRNFQGQFKTVFLLEVFINLFWIIRPLTDALNTQTPETAFATQTFETVLKTLQGFIGRFEEMWKLTIVNFETDESKRPQLEMEKTEEKSTYRTLYVNIINCLYQQIKIRFEHLAQLEFFHVLNRDKYANVKLQDYVKKLIKAHGSCFNLQHIYKEIQLLSSNANMPEGKSVYELLQYFIDRNLQSSYVNLYKLSQLVLSMPCKPPTVSGDSSILHKITLWTYTPEKITGDVSLLCIEKDIFLDLRKGKTFYDDVIQRFQECNKSMELMYHKT